MTRIAIYARYSSELQKESSIEDQLRVCREYAEKQGWEIVQTYADKEESGASLLRPGIQSLFEDAQSGSFELVLSEALDRISRDQADIAIVYRDMTFQEIRLHTLSEGAIDQLHVGLKGTMNALFLKDLKLKIRRGMRGRIENGKSGGGIGYGYAVLKQFDANGEPIRGDRTIKEDEAAIIRRIFDEYGAGMSPREIAKRLNAEGVKAPRGDAWSPSSINGNRLRGAGIINNELYVGRLVWNRQKFIKDPKTGKRITRYNPQSEWVIHDVPELRIVTDEQWEKVRERQGSLDLLTEDSIRERASERARRPKYLLTGLAKCGCCGSAYVVKNATQIGCANYFDKGQCRNSMRVKRQEVEEMVLEGLRTRLMEPAMYEEFCREYTRSFNALQTEKTRARASKEAELERNRRRVKQMVDAICEGMPALPMKDEMVALEARREVLEAELAVKDEPVPMLHPSLAIRYRDELEKLHTGLTSEENRTEAFDVIRGLIDRVIVQPQEDGYSVTLEGDLCAILNLAGDKDLCRVLPLSGVTMVAEEGLEPPTPGL
ncbi:recombinase family protein [Stakelama sediminis]|uniref:recombinase family protein n=1 Tax=Stakelama sediminis TaxID=463200 RepID=UPI00161A2D8A|nr:recombinase family protein [Stakelama sediminis]